MRSILKNSYRITFGSFLAYFVMSAVISPLGLVSTPVAARFDVSITTATAAFTWLTSGVLLGTIVAVFVFDYLRLKQVILGGTGLICLSIAAMYLVDHFAAFAIGLGVIGACCGIELSAGAVVISKLYDERMRASMLLLTDSFYSIAGVLSTSLAGVLLARQFHWSSAYLLAFAATAAIAVIAATSRYPDVDRRSDSGMADAQPRAWPAGVHVIGLAMLIYLVGFVSIYSWVPNYAQAALGVPVEAAGRIVSRMFLGMFIGQLLMFFLVLRFPLRALIVIYASMATLLTVSLWLTQSALQLEWAMLALGLATGGLFKTVLSYGTTMVSDPSPKMISYLIFHAGLGTAVAPYLSSFVVERGEIVAALQLASACYAGTLVLIVATTLSRSRQTAGERG